MEAIVSKFGSDSDFTNSDTFHCLYSPQALINLHETSGKFSVSPGGTLSNDTFHWYRNGKLVKTIVGDSTYSTKRAGSYYVAVTNSIATQLTLYSDTVIISGLTQEKYVAQNQKPFVIYPNPATDKLNISINVTKDEVAQMQIINAEGKILLNQNINLSSGTSNQTINVSKLAKGNYFITIKRDEGMNTTKFVKQ